MDSTGEREVCSSLKSYGSQTISSTAQHSSYSCSNIITLCGYTLREIPVSAPLHNQIFMKF